MIAGQHFGQHFTQGSDKVPSFRFVLAASHAGEERDIWRLVREPNQVVEWTAKYPKYHHTMKNGQRPHYTAQDGIDSPPRRSTRHSSPHFKKHTLMWGR